MSYSTPILEGAPGGSSDSVRRLQSCLDRIEAREAEIGAWVALRSADALEEARCTGAPSADRPLAGLPIGVKDVFDTYDLPTAYGSAAYKHFQPAADAACVAMARRAGAVILGKTTTTEFAAVAPCSTRNPHALSHTPGGSSSGSVAAVAAGMVPAAFGTQTAGSIIRPSSYCGVVGFKPSFGVIPRAGLKTLADSFDTVGVIAADVALAALLASVAADRSDWRNPTAMVPRIGLCKTPLWSRAAPDVTAKILAVLERLAGAGGTLGEVQSPADYLDLVQSHVTIMGWEVRQSLADELRRQPDKLNPRTVAFALPDPAIGYASYADAVRHVQSARDNAETWFGTFDVIATLAALDTAPAGLDSTGDTICNRVWSALHVPCISIPIGRGASGLPIGLQLVARLGADADLLRAAAFVEAVVLEQGGG